MKSSLLLYLLIFFSCALSAQSKFIIKGNSEFYNNKELRVSLFLTSQKDSLNTKVSIENPKINVDKNSFIINGNISKYSHPLKITYYNEEKNRLYSTIFFLDNIDATYNIKLSDLSKKNQIIIKNSKSNNEYNTILNQLETEKIAILPFDENNFQRKSIYLKNYIKNNPYSFVALWMIVIDYNYIGFKSELLENLHLFGGKIKHSDLYKNIINAINTDLTINIEKTFPKMKFQDTAIDSIYGDKYTLIDFWFSYCSPCISEMPKFKLIYDKYNKKDFEYIGISTDRTKDITNWKRIIKENNLTWYNFLDENGEEAKKYNINRFPSNFLLNSEGIIIQKDISPENLKIFLEQNLK